MRKTALCDRVHSCGKVTLREFINNFAPDVLRTSVSEAWEKGVCAACLEPAPENCYSDAGRREYHLSGLCERCFDAMFKEEEEQ